MSTQKSIWSRIAGRVGRQSQKLRFRRSLRHLHGPAGVSTPSDAVVAVVLVRDGMFYMDQFLDHYRQLGVTQFVFCDNGSSDGTIERLKTEPDTVVLQSLLPWGQVENDFRRHAAERYATDRWCLFADMDEMFDFEGAASHGLKGLTQYLSSHGYTAMMAQMLEMFPKASIRAAGDLSYGKALATFRYFDLREIERRAYHDRAAIAFSYFLENNTLSNPDMKVLFGGVRARVFGEQCCLTKHPLVHISGGLEPGVHPHCAAHAKVADITGLIRHYKFANRPEARDAETVARGAIPHGEDRARLDVLGSAPEVSLWSPEAELYSGVAQLIARGFVETSKGYSTYLQGN